jgi:hypothetical protein
MVVIFGWGAGEARDFGEVAPTTCPNCHNQVFLHHIRSDKHVSLYFVPVVPYGSDEYLACPICRAGIRIHPAQRGAVTRMQAATSAYRRRVITVEAYQPSVERFWRELGMDPSGRQVLHPTATVPPPEAAAVEPRSSFAGQLERLGELHAEGVLTDEEFAAAKRRLLES